MVRNYIGVWPLRECEHIIFEVTEVIVYHMLLASSRMRLVRCEGQETLTGHFNLIPKLVSETADIASSTLS